MSKIVRSARGELIDFELLAIKQQLAAAPVPKVVEQRKAAIDAKDGVKTDVAPDLQLDDMLAIGATGAKASAAAGKQLKRK
jgi:hypothetical protein